MIDNRGTHWRLLIDALSHTHNMQVVGLGWCSLSLSLVECSASEVPWTVFRLGKQSQGGMKRTNEFLSLLCGVYLFTGTTRKVMLRINIYFVLVRCCLTESSSGHCFILRSWDNEVEGEVFLYVTIQLSWCLFTVVNCNLRDTLRSRAPSHPTLFAPSPHPASPASVLTSLALWPRLWFSSFSTTLLLVSVTQT